MPNLLTCQERDSCRLSLEVKGRDKLNGRGAAHTLPPLPVSSPGPAFWSNQKRHIRLTLLQTELNLSCYSRISPYLVGTPVLICASVMKRPLGEKTHAIWLVLGMTDWVEKSLWFRMEWYFLFGKIFYSLASRSVALFFRKYWSLAKYLQNSVNSVWNERQQIYRRRKRLLPDTSLNNPTKKTSFSYIAYDTWLSLFLFCW
jgi:hypothetical protein